MRAEDLHHKELLELDPDQGIIRFAGQRALLLDAVAIGLLRKYLVENFGLTAARTVLTHFGFAHGWRMAEAAKAEFTWDTADDWMRAGTRIHSLEGLFRAEANSPGPRSEAGMTLSMSYEAEQHLLHFGQADSPVCWTICGLTSGYLTRSSGEEVFVLEDRCLGGGQMACHLQGKTRKEWGRSRAADLQFFNAAHLKDSLNVSLRWVTETLQQAEQKLGQRRRALMRMAPKVEDTMGIVAKSTPMRHLVGLAKRIARVDSTVLITGQSGAGKERIAQLVHAESVRAAGPFVAVNCGAITETLLESELFGHARGSFSGATQDRPGLFEAAHSGTLFLDEIGEVSIGMQVKLLRVLQEREVRRVGENRSRSIDVRLVAATNRDLEQAIVGGTFRQDLYYRLKVVELHVPALQDRRDDILPLARVLLAEAASAMKRSITGLAPAAADQLLRYPWPGNVRELENAMERAVALARGTRIELEDLPEEVRGAVDTSGTLAGAVRTLEEVERDHILATLTRNGGNQSLTAEQLQIGSATLYRRLKRYGVLASQRVGRSSRRAASR